VRHFPAIWRGEYQNPERISDFLVQEVELCMDPPTPFQVGGDFHCVTGEMRVRWPHAAIRLVDFYAPPSGTAPEQPSQPPLAPALPAAGAPRVLVSAGRGPSPEQSRSSRRPKRPASLPVAARELVATRAHEGLARISHLRW
jgi:hypothetical protein